MKSYIIIFIILLIFLIFLISGIINNININKKCINKKSTFLIKDYLFIQALTDEYLYNKKIQLKIFIVYIKI